MTCERAATKLGLLLGQWNTRLRLPEARYGAVDSALRAKRSKAFLGEGAAGGSFQIALKLQGLFFIRECEISFQTPRFELTGVSALSIVMGF